jgi:hypothetical protein
MTSILPFRDIPTAEIKGQTVTLVFTVANITGEAAPILIPLDGTVFSAPNARYCKMVSASLSSVPSTLPSGTHCICIAWNGGTKVVYSGISPGIKTISKELDRVFVSADSLAMVNDEHFRPIGTGAPNLSFWLAYEDGTDVVLGPTDASFVMRVNLLVF